MQTAPRSQLKVVFNAAKENVGQLYDYCNFCVIASHADLGIFRSLSLFGKLFGSEINIFGL